ncbi:TIGR03915 family putative DNA repair protein [Paraflavitalea pollutisoli]|uniref:TIGR03915 family putative DNA repair protein n=1 Tax=Paraflavitalea pollutisoli TaxID=3034143 RepID=UPI0023EDBB7F|nr:TIGR03915 family putative DNA repair protein [Paraflavitalea sp. H1-2-19X]
MITVVTYDGSFEGLLTAVFEVYEYKLAEVAFSRSSNYQDTIFNTTHQVVASGDKCRRVWKGLEHKLSAKALGDLYKAFLSEQPDIDNVLLDYIRHVFANTVSVEQDFSHPAVLRVVQMARMVHREKHRMEAFVRFQLTRDHLYYAVVEPDFDVLPLIRQHFQDRYADQLWLIYDARRKYGIYYDKESVTTVAMHFSEEVAAGKDIRSIQDEQEGLYQLLWQQYFSSVNILARKNTRLHIQHMPRRYWKYLPEKLL